MIGSVFRGFFKDVLPDVRIGKRAEKIMNGMLNIGSVVINKLFLTNFDKIGVYRMFNNEGFNHNDLV